MAELLFTKDFDKVEKFLFALEDSEIVEFEDEVKNFPLLQDLPENWEGYIIVEDTCVEDWYVNTFDTFYVRCTVKQLKRIIKQDFTLAVDLNSKSI